MLIGNYGRGSRLVFPEFFLTERIAGALQTTVDGHRFELSNGLRQELPVGSGAGAVSPGLCQAIQLIACPLIGAGPLQISEYV